MRRFSTLLLLILSAASCTVRPTRSYILDQQFVHPYGVEVPRYFWEETGQNGKIITTLGNGITCTQSFYLGVLEGETSYTFPCSTEIERIQIFSHDQIKQETIYYRSGMVYRQVIFNPSEHNLVSEWYENGQLKSYEKFAGNLIAYGEYYDPYGQRISSIEDGNGSRTYRDDDGLLVSIDSYKNGEIDSTSIYYANGSLRDVIPYKNGVVEGLRKSYYPGGEPNTIETWYCGSQSGITTVFVDGQKSEDIPYVGGVKHGVGWVYQDGTFVIQERNWKNDVLHGPCHTYIEGYRTTEWYYKGNKVTKGYYDSFNEVTPVDNAA
jgi:antitoxin component YwqK of YwqJK toxin-antitoxin module